MVETPTAWTAISNQSKKATLSEVNQLSENAAHLLFSKRRDCLVQSRFPIFSQSNKRSERRFNVENNFLIEFFQLFADIFFDISPIGYGVEPIACV